MGRSRLDSYGNTEKENARQSESQVRKAQDARPLSGEQAVSERTQRHTCRQERKRPRRRDVARRPAPGPQPQVEQRECDKRAPKKKEKATEEQPRGRSPACILLLE